MNTNFSPYINYLLPFFQEDEPLRVVDIGYHKTPPLHTFGPAVRPYYLLHLIEKGRGFIERHGEVRHLSAGDAFLIKPGEVTLYCSNKDEPWEYYWISFDGALAEKLLNKIGTPLFPSYQKSGLIALKTAVKNQFNDYMGALNTLFIVLNSIKTTTPPSETKVIPTALHYLENNYFQQIGISELAKQFGFSRAYFSSLFTQTTGETPYDYLIKIRIEKAKTYLQNTAYSIEEIAYSVGFSSPQRFSETFKKRVGLPPLQYRKSVTQSV